MSEPGAHTKGQKGSKGIRVGHQHCLLAREHCLEKEPVAPASVLAALILALLQPSAASRNRVWNPGPVSVLLFHLRFTLLHRHRGARKSISRCQAPNGLRCALMLWHGGRRPPSPAEGSGFQLIIKPSAVASEMAMSASAPWQPSLRQPLVSRQRLAPAPWLMLLAR